MPYKHILAISSPVSSSHVNDISNIGFGNTSIFSSGILICSICNITKFTNFRDEPINESNIPNYLFIYFVYKENMYFNMYFKK